MKYLLLLLCLLFSAVLTQREGSSTFVSDDQTIQEQLDGERIVINDPSELPPFFDKDDKDHQGPLDDKETPPSIDNAPVKPRSREDPLHEQSDQNKHKHTEEDPSDEQPVLDKPNNSSNLRSRSSSSSSSRSRSSSKSSQRSSSRQRSGSSSSSRSSSRSSQRPSSRQRSSSSQSSNSSQPSSRQSSRSSSRSSSSFNSGQSSFNGSSRSGSSHGSYKMRDNDLQSPEPGQMQQGSNHQDLSQRKQKFEKDGIHPAREDEQQRPEDDHGHNQEDDENRHSNQKGEQKHTDHRHHHKWGKIVQRIVVPILLVVLLGAIGCCTCCYCIKKCRKRKLQRMQSIQTNFVSQPYMTTNEQSIIQNLQPNPQVHPMVGYPLNQQIQPNQTTQCKRIYYPVSVNDPNTSINNTDRSINTTTMDHQLLNQQQTVFTNRNLYPSLQTNTQQQQ